MIDADAYMRSLFTSDCHPWIGPLDSDLQPGGVHLLRTVPGCRWPYGPPEEHENNCHLHSGGLYCDCRASATE